MEANRSPAVEGAGRALSEWVSDECNRALRQELSPEEEEQHAGLEQTARIKELGEWKKFDVFEPRKGRKVSKQVIQTRRALTRKMVDGHKSVEVRSAATGYQGPEFQGGVVDTSGRVSIRPLVFK